MFMLNFETKFHKKKNHKKHKNISDQKTLDRKKIWKEENK